MNRRHFLRSGACLAGGGILATTPLTLWGAADKTPTSSAPLTLSLFPGQRTLALNDHYDVTLRDFGRHAELVFADGNYRRLARPAAGHASFASAPQYLSATWSPDGKIALLDASHRRVDRFHPDGRYLDSLDLSTFTESPRALTVFNESLLVTDSTGHRVTRINRQGRLITAIGGNPRDLRSLNGPVSAAVDANGQIHVLEAGHRRISVWSSEGRLIDSYGNGELTAGCRSLVFDGSGQQALVMDSWQNELLLPGKISGREYRIGYGSAGAGQPALTTMSYATGKGIYLSA